MPQVRRTTNEHPSASHSDAANGQKFVVQPVMSKNPDQPDQWTVSGVDRSYASAKDADKVRAVLKKSKSPRLRDALETGAHIDDALPTHLKKLPSWDQVHGVKASKEEGLIRKVIDTLVSPEKQQANAKGLHSAVKAGKFVAKVYAASRLGGDTPRSHLAAKGIDAVGKLSDKMIDNPVESVNFGGLALIEALEYIKESLTCGCYEKMELANEALAQAVYGVSLEEAKFRHRRKVGVKSFKKIPTMRRIRSRGHGAGAKVHAAPKMHHAIRQSTGKGSSLNRTRRPAR